MSSGSAMILTRGVVDASVLVKSFSALARALALPFITADAALVRKLGGSNAELLLLGDLA